MSTTYTLRVSDNASITPYSDKANLPSAILQNLIEEGTDFPHPLVFKIANESDPFNYTYIGVKEFTSESDEIMLPRFVSDKLHNPTTVVVEMRRDIPKATSLRLKPLLFYPINNWKHFLESRLSHYTVVNKGDVLTIEDGGLKYQLQAEQINDSDAVNVASIIDTDVVLDMVPLNDSVAEQQLEFHRNYYDQFGSVVELKSGEEVVIHGLSSFMDPKFVPRLYSIDITQWNSHSLVVELVTENPARLINVDFVVGTSKLLTLDNFAYSSLAEDDTLVKQIENGLGTRKAINIDLRDDLIVNKLNRSKSLLDEGESEGDVDADERFLYVIPFTWQGKEDVLLRISDKKEHETVEADTGDLKKCPKCFKLIPKDNFTLHEARCRKHKSEPVDSQLLKFKHKQLYEKQYQCSCSQTFATFFDMVNHKARCPNTMIECRFCHLIVPQETATYEDTYQGLTHHENVCGNKTQECYKCGKVIRRKDLVKHMKLHELDKVEYNHAVTFNKCANVNCINSQSESANELQLCDLCFGPLYISQNDPTNIKLQSRIERKYMLQLSKGCGQCWCNNEFCKTGNPKLSHNTMKDNLQLMQVAFASIHKPLLPINNKNGAGEGENGSAADNMFWFCVNESVSKKKLWFDMLKEEGEYANDDIILQALKVNNDESSVRQWLKSNAISGGSQ
ncbi:hypothetical protein KGF57_000829 [Candida theae]|uniref:Ubiquitin-protein ligase E3A N-terminal zinc-binding domain-containing protein n=1 Tax=Candida theae TaxID=1198502 RepID=A0AAD5BIL9_9ASCO|nr:uncharacterized protein KGF57_000829 [Candida theae]KAI5965036.1 hypothetical protein KGF57_000829 [Candida theae]